MTCCCHRSPLWKPQNQYSGQLNIDASGFDTANVLFFDRYRIERGPSFYECHFGFYGQMREVRAGLIVVIPRQVAEEVRESFMQYLQQLGSMPDTGELPPCSLRTDTPVVSADIVGAARHGKVLAEIIFHTF